MVLTPKQVKSKRRQSKTKNIQLQVDNPRMCKSWYTEGLFNSETVIFELVQRRLYETRCPMKLTIIIVVRQMWRIDFCQQSE